MLEFVHHKVLPAGGNYTRALWAWQEPEHMAETRFFDKARNFLMSKTLGPVQNGLLGRSDTDWQQAAEERFRQPGFRWSAGTWAEAARQGRIPRASAVNPPPPPTRARVTA